jgi:hypothetical protein
MNNSADDKQIIVKSYKYVFTLFLFIFAMSVIIIILPILERDLPEASFFILFGSFAIISLTGAFFTLPYTIKLFENKIEKKRLFYKARKYDISNISRINLGVDSFSIFIGEKKIMRVSYNSTGCLQLMYELHNLGVSAYKRGNLIQDNDIIWDKEYWGEYWDE